MEPGWFSYRVGKSGHSCDCEFGFRHCLHLESSYLVAAEKNAAFLKAKLWDAKTKTLYHRWRDGQRDNTQLLEGYAFLLRLVFFEDRRLARVRSVGVALRPNGGDVGAEGHLLLLARMGYCRRCDAGEPGECEENCSAEHEEVWLDKAGSLACQAHGRCAGKFRGDASPAFASPAP